jgi:tripartite-type tricarboxylate transporter receptor subunit TctC
MTPASSRAAFAAALVAVLPVGAARAQGADTFFKGKTISVYIGFSAGGTYDYFGRLLTRHLGKHVPGNPTVIAQAMPGAGSLTLANWMYRIAPKDGTAIGIASQTLAIDEALKSPGILYKSNEFNWIGRATSNVEITVIWERSKVKKAADALVYDVPLASTGAGSPSEGYHKLLNATIGTKFKLIGPYPGSTDGLLAMERGETDAAFTSWNTLNVTKHDWLDSGKTSVLIQYAQERHPDMANVPTMVELGKTDEDKAMFAFDVSGGEVGRSFLAPPGVPADRIAVLRQAFDETMKDPELLAEIEKAKLDFHPDSGVKLQKIIADTANVSPAIVARMQSLLK